MQLEDFEGKFHSAGCCKHNSFSTWVCANTSNYSSLKTNIYNIKVLLSFQHNTTVQPNQCTVWPIRLPSSLILPSHHKTLCVCVLRHALKVRHLTGLLYSTFWSQTERTQAAQNTRLHWYHAGKKTGWVLSGGKRATRSNVSSLQASCRRFSPALFWSKRRTQAEAVGAKGEANTFKSACGVSKKD